MLDHTLRPVRVILVSIAVCVLLGVPLGTFFAGVIGGAPLLFFGVDIGGVPGFAYALMIGGPIAAADGAIVPLLLLAVLRWREPWHPAWYGWIVAGSAVGVLVSAIPPGLILVQMPGPDSENVPLLEVLGLLSVTGCLCGAVLGLYGWFERRGLRSATHG